MKALRTGAPETGGCRFAPSPTGRFHIGNLRTAWISRLWARQFRLPWVVRFEDIDTPRVRPEARAAQVQDLRALGLIPDHELLQSHFLERHRQLFSLAIKTKDIYPCDCSRQNVTRDVSRHMAQIASAPHEKPPEYTGRCRDLDGDRRFHAAESLAWRMKMPEPSGRDDFIVARTGLNKPFEESFVPSYNWACAIDDLDGAYQLIVRASDLAVSLRPQRRIQDWMLHQNVVRATVQIPAVFHTSLIVHAGHRLEKRTEGVTLSELLARGISPERLGALFEQSFDHGLLQKPQAGVIMEEKAPTMELSLLL